MFWFHDVRDPLNRSRRVAAFHTPAALQEMLGRDFTGVCQWFEGNINAHSLLRPYQIEANTAAQAVRAFESFWPTRIESSCQYDLGWQERYDKMSWNC